MPKFNQEEQQFDQEVLDIDRVTRMVAGGRRFSFRAVVGIGDRKGKVGLGVAKAKDLTQAVEKAARQATKNLIEVVAEEGSIPMKVIGHFKSADVLLKPAVKGRGLVAGGVVRTLASLAGIENLSAKIVSRTNNKLNIARATLDAFKKLSLYQEKLAKKTKASVKKEKGKVNKHNQKSQKKN